VCVCVCVLAAVLHFPADHETISSHYRGPTNGLSVLLRVGVLRISVHLHQPVHLRYQVRAGEKSPSAHDSVEEVGRTHTHTHARTHTHTPPFNGPFSGTTQVGRYTRKVKPIWILLKQETVSGRGISWAICQSASRSRQITTPVPHHSVFYRPDALPAAQPTV